MKSSDDSSQPFFYATSEAGAYDSTIEWVAPYYREMHQMMLRLAVESVPIAESDSDKKILALDIGSGTGAEAIPLLQTIPNLHVLGLDIAKPMNDLFRENATNRGVAENRYRLIDADILDPAAYKTIRREANNAFGDSHFELIISAFTLHHLDTAQKAKVFQMIHSLLGPGGIFLLGDLFNFGGESSWLTSSIFNWELSWIANNFEQGAMNAEKAGNTVEGMHLRALKKEWSDHYQGDNKLDGVTTQLTQLRSAGFSEAGSPFRYWQVGLIWARA